MYIYTHTHLCTHSLYTHLCTHTATHTQHIPMCTHPCMHPCTPVYTHACTQVHTPACTPAHMRAEARQCWAPSALRPESWSPGCTWLFSAAPLRRAFRQLALLVNVQGTLLL